MINTDFFIQEPEHIYHEQSGGEILSSTLLKHFHKSEVMYEKAIAGLLPKEDKKAYFLGTAGHKLILEGDDEYAYSYTTDAPINEKTGKYYGKETKKHQEWQEQSSKLFISPSDNAKVQNMAHGVGSHEMASHLLKDGVAERVVRTEYMEMMCQIRIDFFNNTDCMSDLKSCQDLDFFEYDAKRYRYPNQAAFYQSLMHKMTGKYLPYYWIAIESSEPYRCGVWKISDGVLQKARNENEAAMRRLKVCKETGIYSTGFEHLRSFETD